MLTVSLMLLDTASLYYRAYYGVPETLTSPRGEPVNAIRGVLDMAARLIGARHPNRFAACLDLDWRPEWRVALIPSYKTHRVLDEDEDDSGVGDAEITPDTLAPQIPVIFEVFEALGLALAGAEEFEADDVIATLATTQPGPTDIVTGDRDLFQLVDDSVRVLYTSKGVAQYQEVDRAWVAEKYNIPGHLYADFATLRGDSSDGLPGVRGIGEKTAAQLVSKFGGVDAIVAAAHDSTSEMTPAVRKKLLEGQEYLKVAPDVVRCARDVPLEDLDLGIHPDKIDRTQVKKLKEYWGLGVSMDRMIAVLEGGGS